MEIIKPLLIFIFSILGVFLAGIAIKWIFYCGTVGICEGRKKAKSKENTDGKEEN